MVFTMSYAFTLENAQPRVQISFEVRVSGPQGVTYGKLHDLSRMDARFHATELVGQVGDPLDLFLPFSDETEVAVMGDLLRLEPTTRSLLHEVEFNLVEPNMQNQLQQVIGNLLKSTGGGTRKHPRIMCQSTARTSDPTKVKAVLETISLGGVGIILDHALNLGGEVKFTIARPKFNGSAVSDLHLVGRVVNQNLIEGRQPERYRVGIEFKNLTHKSKTRLQGLISETLELS